MPTVYTYVHPSAGFLESGRPLGFGDEVDLEDRELETPHNKRLVAEGRLLDAKKPKKPSKPIPAPKRKVS